MRRGAAAARNRALNASRGKYVGFLDADDLFEATKLATVTIWKSIVDTNMTLADMMTAAGYAFDLRSAEIEQLRIPVGNTGHEFYYYDMATQEIDYEANREALQAFLLESYTVRGVDDADDWDW